MIHWTHPPQDSTTSVFFPCGLAGKVPPLHRFDMPGRSSSGVRNYWQNSNLELIYTSKHHIWQKMCNYISWHAMFIYFLCMNRNVEVLHGFWVPIILCTMTKGRPRHRKSQGFIFDVEYCIWNTRKDQNWRISILATGMSLKPVLSQVATFIQVPVSNFHMVLGNAGITGSCVIWALT